MMTRALPLFLVACVLVLLVTAIVPNDHTASIRFGDVVLHAEVADELPEQVRGLSGRDSLAENEAMLFLFSNAAERAFWMKDMRFAVDIIWLRDHLVVGITSNVQPEPDVADDALTRYRSPEPVDMVVEIAAGAADAFDIRKGNAMIY